LLIGTLILFISWDAAKRIWGRLMDSVDPALTERVEQIVCSQPGVDRLEQLRLRFVGHKLHGDMRLEVAPSAPGSLTAELRHQLGHEVPQLVDGVIETTPVPVSRSS
jgi:divalent metal cation (Fe/Co/Zn/Cd) transporter